MNCLICNKEGCSELANEVDIGVGVQRHIFGFECIECGQMSVCSVCGAIGEQPHRLWCSDFKMITETTICKACGCKIDDYGCGCNPFDA